MTMLTGLVAELAHIDLQSGYRRSREGQPVISEDLVKYDQ